MKEQEKIKFDINEYRKEVEESNRECVRVKMCTERLTEDQKKEYVKNLNKVYEFSKLEKPNNVVFVSSPMLLAFAGGASRYYWNEIVNKGGSATLSATLSATASATRSATYSATDSATLSATRSATASATRSATYSATLSATASATRSATYSATDSATLSATDSATRSATASATRSATDSAEISTGILVPENYMEQIKLFFNEKGITPNNKLLNDYIKSFTSVYQGGNNWADWDFYLNFYRKIGKQIPNHDYSGFDAWSSLNIAGARILEKDFAMISEKPISIKVKGNLAHNLHGPAIEYMDGVKFYMAYGNFIPSWIVTTPLNEITKEKILSEKNADFRRYLIERIGIEKYINILGATKIDSFKSKVGGLYELLSVSINNEKCLYLKMINQSEGVFHIEGIDNSCKNVKEALQFRNGMKTFKEPKYLS